MTPALQVADFRRARLRSELHDSSAHIGPANIGGKNGSKRARAHSGAISTLPNSPAASG
jgi:hypothetical protein